MSDGISVVHISDFHFSQLSTRDSGIVVAALSRDLREQRDKGAEFDLVVFSGDLVQSGESKEDFRHVVDEVAKNVALAAGVPSERVVFCPGNHDIDRLIVRRDNYIEVGLRATLKDRGAINTFIDAHANTPIVGSLPPPLLRLENFYKEVWDKANAGRVLLNPFLAAYEFEVREEKLGIACFNTAWRTTGEAENADYGHLILGERVVDAAAVLFKDASLRIAVFHHPLSWLNDADQAAVEGRLQAEFDLLLFGHIHRSSPEFRQTAAGDAILSQAGCLYYSRDFFNGYNIITMKPDSGKVEIRVQEYSDERRRFLPAIRKLDEGKISYPLVREGDRARAVLPGLLRRVRPAIRHLGNSHISLVGSDGVELDIETHFVCPPLSESSVAAARLRESEAREDADEQPCETALKETRSVAIIGASECGKTSLAHFLAVKAASGVLDTPRLPLLCRFSAFKRSDFPLWRAVQNYANEISDGAIKRGIVEQEPLLVIVDDVDVLDAERLEVLNAAIRERTNARWILMVRQPAAAVSLEPQVEQAFPTFRTYRVGDLPRRSIRALSANWLDASAEEQKTDELFRSVMEQIQKTGLPRNGYIVSLIIWALRHRSRGELLNEAVLLQNIIDYMLGRMDYRGALRSEFDFTSKTSVLQHLAYEYKIGQNEPKEKNEVVGFVIELLKRKALRYDAVQVVQGFIGCGVLEQIGQQVFFRYSRFQDFFVAGHLRDVQSAYQDAISPTNWLLYARELDLFTARFRHETSLLSVAKERLESIKVLEPRLQGPAVLEYLHSGPRLSFSERQLRKMRKEPMTADKIDKLLDDADRRVQKTRQEEDNETKQTGEPPRSRLIVEYYMALEIYSQFIRNLEFVDREDKRAHLSTCVVAWERAMRGWLSGLQQGMEEFRQDIESGEAGAVADGSGSKKKIAPEKIVQLSVYVETYIKSVVPTIVAEMMYHCVGSEKLVDILDEVMRDEGTTGLGTLVSGFVLLELDASRGFERLAALVARDRTDMWLVNAITQRLYSYYTSRPLPPDLRTKFESFLADLEMTAKGISRHTHVGAKGQVLQEVKKKAFREETDVEKSN